MKFIKCSESSKKFVRVCSLDDIYAINLSEIGVVDKPAFPYSF